MFERPAKLLLLYLRIRLSCFLSYLACFPVYFIFVSIFVINSLVCLLSLLLLLLLLLLSTFWVAFLFKFC